MDRRSLRGPSSCSYDKAGTVRLFAEEIEIALLRHIDPWSGHLLQSPCSAGRDEVSYVVLGIGVGN
jgi:hypothetical protein